jgi:hypothetical protein
MSQSKFPPGWDEQRVSRVLEHYDSQTDEEAGADCPQAPAAPNKKRLTDPSNDC